MSRLKVDVRRYLVEGRVETPEPVGLIRTRYKWTEIVPGTG